jgi:predicted P-loop ATPase
MSDNYLKERPSPSTVAPLDPRMSRAQRWTVWTAKKIEGKPKPAKVPLGRSNDPSTWTFFAAARYALTDTKIAGLGFQMYGRPEVIGIDIDRCIAPTGEFNSLASQLLAQLTAAGGKFHVEITPSGLGLRIFAGETPLPFHDFLNEADGLEVYAGETARFLTFTGSMVPGFGEGPFSPLPPESVAFLAKYTNKMKEGLGPVGAAPGAPAEGVPELGRREDWKNLYPNAIKRIGKEHVSFLESGALGKKYASASEQLFGIEQALLKLLKPPQAYQVLISAEGSYGVAMEHRENNDRRACEFIWTDLQRAAASKEKYEVDKAVTSAGWKDCDIIVTLTDEGARARLLQINQINAFTKHPDWINRLGYNTFDGRVTLDKKDVTIRQVAEMSAWLTNFLKWDYEPNRVQFEESLTEAAKMRPWNPIEDELRAIPWDGIRRIKKFALALCGEEYAPLDVEIARKWLVGYVARGLKPGCQMDTVLCMRERDGGGFKTTFARIMAGTMDRFSDSPGFGSDKESSMLRVGQRIVELSEGVAAKKSDKNELKRDLTKLADHFRAPWGKTADKRPRGFVYILTANDIAFLRSDQDGLRRIWPMDVASIIDIAWIKENRDQLLAESVALYDAGEAWWWDKGHEPEELRSRQFSAVAEDFLDGPVEAIIRDVENRQRGYTTLAEMKKTVEALAGLALNTSQAQHLLDVLAKHGLRGQVRRIDGHQMRVWIHDAWGLADGEEAKVLNLQERRDTLLRPVTGEGVTDILE